MRPDRIDPVGCGLVGGHAGCRLAAPRYPRAAPGRPAAGRAGDRPGDHGAGAVGGQVQQHGRGQAARAGPQPGEQRTARGGHRDADGDPGRGLPAVPGQPVDLQRSGGRADMPDAEHAARHGDRGGLGQHPPQRGLQHAPEGDLLPQHGAHRDAERHLVGEPGAVQGRDPLIVQERTRGRQRGGGQVPGHRGGGERRSEPPGPPRAAAEAQLPRGQAARRGSRQRRGGGAPVGRRVPAAMPRLRADHVVVAGQDGTRRDREPGVAPGSAPGCALATRGAPVSRRGVRGRSRRRAPRPGCGPAARASSGCVPRGS